jgi:hypothetical protein
MIKSPDFFCNGGFQFAVAIGAGGAGGVGGIWASSVGGPYQLPGNGQEAGNTILSGDPTARNVPYPSVEAEGGFGGGRGFTVPNQFLFPRVAVTNSFGGPGGNSYYMSGGGGGTNNATNGSYTAGVGGAILTGGATPAD